MMSNTGQSLRILVIDDDKFVRNSLALTLEWAGYDVSEAASLSQGLAFHQENPVSVVVADDINTYEDGIEYIQTLREYSPTLPIIAISGTVPSRGQEHYSLNSVLGSVFYLQKPFTVDELLSTIQTALPRISVPDEQDADILAIQY